MRRALRSWDIEAWRTHESIKYGQKALAGIKTGSLNGCYEYNAGGNLVGVASYYIHVNCFMLADKHIHLAFMATYPTGDGAGRKLIIQLKAQGLPIIVVATKESHGFYEHLGAERLEKYPNYVYLCKIVSLGDGVMESPQ